MNIGQLRHKIEFQRATLADNALGEPVETWARIVNTWGRVEGVAGKERYAAMQVQADVDFRILCRWQPKLDALAPNDRVVWGAKIFDIKSAINTEGRNVQIEIFAKQHI